DRPGRRCSALGRARLDGLRRPGARGGLSRPGADDRLQPAAPGRAGGRAADCGRAGRPPPRSAARPQGLRRVRADRRYRGAQACPERSRGRRSRRRYPRHLRSRAQHHLPQPRARLGRGGRGARPVRRGQCAGLFGLPRLPARVHRRVRGAGQPRHQGGRGRGRVHRPRAAAAHDQGRHCPRSRAAGPRRWGQPQLLRPGAGRSRLRPVRRVPAAGQGIRRSRAARPDALPM
ncbi:MAG: 7-cyano-7-deazaguanine synthase, partial [uncultured Sphingomonas sp.]